MISLHWVTDRPGTAALCSLATAVAYALYASGLRTTEVSRAATLSLAEPVTATLLGVALLEERVGPAEWSGATLIVVALFSLLHPPSQRVPPQVPYGAGTKPGS